MATARGGGWTGSPIMAGGLHSFSREPRPLGSPATVWGRASAVLFLTGRLHFHFPDGSRAAANSGAPSVLVAYGNGDAIRLRDSGLDGVYIDSWR